METGETPRLLGLKSVKDRTSLSEPTIRRLIDREQFPRPVKIAPNRIAWLESDLIDWVNSRGEAA